MSATKYTVRVHRQLTESVYVEVEAANEVAAQLQAVQLVDEGKADDFDLEAVTGFSAEIV